MKLVRFTEENVDGCGTDAEVIIQVNTDEPVNSKILEGIISEYISGNKEEDLDTDTIVAAACEKYFGSRNIEYKLADVIEIEF